MKFSCAQSDLAHVLKLCANVAQVTGYDATMANVHMETGDHAVRFSAANGYSAVSTWARAEVEEEGSFSTDCWSLRDFVFHGGDAVLIKYLPKTNRISVKSGGDRALMNRGGNPPVHIPDEFSGEYIKLRGQALIPVLSIANLAGSKNPDNSANALWLAIDGGYIRAAGTDSYRAGYAWELIDDKEAKGSFFLHKDTALALQRAFAFDDVINVYKLGGRLFFDTGTTVFAAHQFAIKKSGAKHPQLVALAAQEKISYFEVDSREFMTAIRRCVSIFRRSKNLHRIVFTAEPRRSRLHIQTNKENEIGNMHLKLGAGNIVKKSPEPPPEPKNIDYGFVEESFGVSNWADLVAVLGEKFAKKVTIDVDDFRNDAAGLTKEAITGIKKSVVLEFILDAYYIKEILEAMKQLIDSNPDITASKLTIAEVPNAYMVSVTQAGVNAVYLIGIMK